MELSREIATRYHKISHDPVGIERLLVDLFLDAHVKAPKQITFDFDVADAPLRGQFFHGYYDLLLSAAVCVLRSASPRRQVQALQHRRQRCCAGRDRAHRHAHPQTLAANPHPAADSGFARDSLMVWREENRIDSVFGLARNKPLEQEIYVELANAEEEVQRTGKPARRFEDFRYSTLSSLSRRRQGRMDA